MKIDALAQKNYKNVVSDAELAEFVELFRNEIAPHAFGAVVTKVEVPADEIELRFVKGDEDGKYFSLNHDGKIDFMHVGEDIEDDNSVYLYALLVGHVY